MQLIRWQPGTNLWNEMGRVRDEMNRVFERWGNGTWPVLGTAYPPLNVWEDQEHVYVEAELPGLKLENLEIYVSDGNQLSIKGQRPVIAEEKGVWHRQERGFGSFARVVTLPFAVDENKVEARLELGVLHISLPKSERAKPRRIEVKAE